MKAGFELLARCENNSNLTLIAKVMIEILKSSDTLCKTFLKSLLDNNNAELVMEILLEANDKSAQLHVARVIKYLFCKMKVLEKEDIQSNAKETFKDTFIDSDGKEHNPERERPKALSLRFLKLLLSHLSGRATKNWKTFDYYLELIAAFALHSHEEMEVTADQDMASCPWSKESEAYQIGMELCFKWNLIEVLGDFMLGEKSPLHVQGEKREEMGNSYVKVNFKPILSVITTMMMD